MMDRVFDNYVMTPMQRIVLDRIRPKDQLDRHGVAEACKLLDTAYAGQNGQMAGRQWAAGEQFSLADSAAAPALLYADWAHPLDDGAFPHLRAYRRRLLARPSFARAVEEAPPYRQFFPLGPPEQALAWNPGRADWTPTFTPSQWNSGYLD